MCPGAPVPSFVACRQRLSCVLRSGRVRGPRFFAGLRQWLELEPRAKVQGPILAPCVFRAWKGRVQRQESWLTRQVPA